MNDEQVERRLKFAEAFRARMRRYLRERCPDATNEQIENLLNDPSCNTDLQNKAWQETLDQIGDVWH